MKWLEIIELRSAEGNQEFLESQLQKIINEADKETKEQAIKTYSRVMIDNDFNERSPPVSLVPVMIRTTVMLQPSGNPASSPVCFDSW